MTAAPASDRDPRLVVAERALEQAGADGAARRVADAVRALTETLMAEDCPDTALDGAAAAVREAGDSLRAASRGARSRAVEDGNPRDPTSYFRHSPLIGTVNPLAPPMVLTVHDGGVSGAVTFGTAYQGPPGYVHGAYVAAVFDELLGVANVSSGNPAMTGRLDVRYHRPTPLYTALRLEGRHTGRDGRKIFATGELYAGDTLTAEATGVFVEVTATRARELFGNRLTSDAR
jgi:acyl-coenzyme A thioesterase PaaI-like protein